MSRFLKLFIHHLLTKVRGDAVAEYLKVYKSLIKFFGKCLLIKDGKEVPSTVLTLVLVIALVLLINHTKIGMAMRAVSRDFETAQLMGIRINSVISVTFIIGSLLAAIGSLLYFTNYQSIVPLSGSLPGLRAFVAAVFGGIGSIPGAVVGAFLIGICESVIKGSDWSVFSDAFSAPHT